MTKDDDVSWFTSGRPLTRRGFNGLGGVTLTREAPRAQLTDTGIVGFDHEVDPLSRVLHETKDPNDLARAAKDWKRNRRSHDQ